MRLITVIDRTNFLSLAEGDQRPLGVLSIGMIQLGRVDPCKADTGSTKVNGVAVDHLSPPAQFENIDDKDFGGSTGASSPARRQPLFKCGCLIAGDGGAARRRIEPDYLGFAAKATARTKCNDGADNKQ